MGGAAGPPNPPLFFCAMQAVFQENRTINTNFSTRSCYVVFNILSNHTRCLFANEVLRSRQHPRVIFKLCKIAAAIILATKTKPIWTPSELGGCTPPTPLQANFKYLRTSKDRTHMDLLRTRERCLQMGGACPPPPQPPRFFLTPCSLVFKNPEPVIKVFQIGGGAAPPPPSPPAFFNTMQAGKIAPSTRIASNT